MNILGLYCIAVTLAATGAQHYYKAQPASFDERFGQWGVHRDKVTPPPIIKPRLRTQVAEASRMIGEYRTF